MQAVKALTRQCVHSVSLEPLQIAHTKKECRLTLFPPVTTFVVYSHLLMFLEGLYCKQYEILKKKALKITSQLVIFRAYMRPYCLVREKI